MQDQVDEGYGKAAGRARGETVKMHIEENVALKQYGTPEAVAKTVAFLARDESAYVSAMTLRVSGAQRHADLRGRLLARASSLMAGSSSLKVKF